MTKSAVALLSALILMASCAKGLHEPRHPSASEMPPERLVEAKLLIDSVKASPARPLPVETILNLLWDRTISQLTEINDIGSFRNKSVQLTLKPSPDGVLPAAQADKPCYMTFKETGDDTVIKPILSFHSGAVEAASLLSGKEPHGDAAALSASLARFSVSSKIDLEETLWNQQITTERKGYDEPTLSFTYQSLPRRRLIVDKGSEVLTQSNLLEQILKGKGWEASLKGLHSITLKGRLSLFRPVRTNAEANTDDPKEESVTRTVEGDFAWEQTRSVTSNETEEKLPEKIVRKLRKVTTSQRTVTVHVPTGRTSKIETIDHTTTFVTLERTTPTGEPLLLQNHEETQREVTHESFTYKDQGSTHEKVKEQWVYRFSDDPLSKNDIRRWISTHQKITSEVEYGVDRKVTDSGLVWITDQIEPDPDATDLPFEILFKFEVDDAHNHEFLGANMDGYQSNKRTARGFLVEISLGPKTLIVDGNAKAASSEIAGAGAKGKFDVASSVNGSVKIKLGGEAWRMDADEFFKRFDSFDLMWESLAARDLRELQPLPAPPTSPQKLHGIPTSSGDTLP